MSFRTRQANHRTRTTSSPLSRLAGKFCIDSRSNFRPVEGKAVELTSKLTLVGECWGSTMWVLMRLCLGCFLMAPVPTLMTSLSVGDGSILVVPSNTDLIVPTKSDGETIDEERVVADVAAPPRTLPPSGSSSSFDCWLLWRVWRQISFFSRLVVSVVG